MDICKRKFRVTTKIKERGVSETIAIEVYLLKLLEGYFSSIPRSRHTKRKGILQSHIAFNHANKKHTLIRQLY